MQTRPDKFTRDLAERIKFYETVVFPSLKNKSPIELSELASQICYEIQQFRNIAVNRPQTEWLDACIKALNEKESLLIPYIIRGPQPG